MRMTTSGGANCAKNELAVTAGPDEVGSDRSEESSEQRRQQRQREPVARGLLADRYGAGFAGQLPHQLKTDCNQGAEKTAAYQ